VRKGEAMERQMSNGCFEPSQAEQARTVGLD
jgi:hypothetical protein